MAYTAPTTIAVGDALTASLYNTYVGANIIDLNARLGQQAGIYTTEAARDAAITSPTEGMQAYLTAPTVPAATGNVTAVPTGVQTIYNGSVWVCVTEVGARRDGDTGYTTTSSSYVTTLTSDGTAISVTLVTGTSALLMFGFSGYSDVNKSIRASVSVSGATTVAATDGQGVVADNITASQQLTVASTYVLTSLTAGTNTFTLNYRGNGGNNVYVRRFLTVKGIA